LSKSKLYKHLDIVLLVIVQDIINKKIVDKQRYLSIYIIDVNKVVLETRSYIIKNIKINIILDNNVLKITKNKISLYLYSKQIQINNIQIFIKFILSKVLSINFYVTSIIAFTTLKLYLKTINK
jgi:2C-methyl-D-erythritol 2,4-cyclodiphosphate synthase